MVDMYLYSLLCLFLSQPGKSGAEKIFPADILKTKLELEPIELPFIRSTQQSFSVPLGDKIILPCQVENLGSYVLLWQKNTEVLTAKSIIVKPDPRYKLMDKYNLQIRNIQSSDAGEYSCKISILGDPIIIKHTLNILVPPKIHPDPIDGNVVVKKGRDVELKCKASGNPEPTIRWSRLNNLLPSGDKEKSSKTLVLKSVDRNDVGTYICRAENGIGNIQAEAQIYLQVLYPPDIELETDRVHSGDEKEAHLTCLIHGNPIPTVRWYKDSMLLVQTNSIRMTSRNNKHILVLKSIRSGLDFGNYSCVAENALGTFKKHIEVHGRPSAAIFHSSPSGSPGALVYLLNWSVDSYAPIEEYRLLYRQIQPYHKIHDEDIIQGGGDWTNVIIPGDPNNFRFNYKQSYLVQNLASEAEYECLVQARNKFGWSEASRIFHFFSHKREPSVRDMEWKSNTSKASKEKNQEFQFIFFSIFLFFYSLFLPF